MSRVVLVTGGSRGIGLACARRFVDQGDKVAVTYPLVAAADDVFGVACDVTSGESVEAAFAAVEEQYGPVEVLVSNAGVTNDGLLLRMSEDDFTSVIDANLTAAYRVAKRATQGMLRARKGRMIFMSSVVGLSGSAGQANYAAPKAGLVGLARSLARELASRSITVNVVAPGPIDTDMTQALPDKRASRADRPRSRSGASAAPTRSPPPSRSWPRPRPGTSPAPSSLSTAAWAWDTDPDHPFTRSSRDEELFGRFRNCAVEVLSVDADKVVPEAKFGDDLDADSLDLVELVMALEEEFDIEVPEEDLEGIETVGQAYDLVVAKIG